MKRTYYSPKFFSEPNVTFNPLQHLGSQSPWFPGPNVNNIPYTVPDGCTIDMAAFISRHGSRYPDLSAYQQWVTFHQKIQNATFTACDSLNLFPYWQPILSDPAQGLSQISLGGYQELYSIGVEYCWRYPSFHTHNTPFDLWCNEYIAAPRVIDSARLFTRVYMGPNTTSLGAIHVLNSTDPRGLANSLGPSDPCPKYLDDLGGVNPTT